jgi:hypothetical protein
MAVLNPQKITRAGLNPAYAAAGAGGDEFVPDSDTYLHVKNGAGVPQTVTVVTPGEAFEGAAIADIAVAVPAGGERIIGPFPADDFADPSNGRADITYSGVVTLTIAVIRLPQR